MLHVQCFHQVHSIFPPAGEAQCAMPILCAASCRCDITAPPRCCGVGLPRRSKAKAGTDGYGWVRRSGTWHTEGYVLGKFRSTWLRDGISQSKVSPREPCAVRYSKRHGGSRAKLQPTTWQRHHAAAKHEFPTPDAGWRSVPCSSASAEGWHCAKPILLAEK